MKRYMLIALLVLMLVGFWAVYAMKVNRDDLEKVARTVLERWESLVRQYSFYYQQVPVDLALAVICEESKGDQNAYNPDDPSRGLMQINVSAHGALAEFNQKTGKNYNEQMMMVPWANVEVGMWYLNEMYDQFGDWDKAVMAYNAGPNNIEAGRSYLGQVAGYRDIVNELLSSNR